MALVGHLRTLRDGVEWRGGHEVVLVRGWGSDAVRVQAAASRCWRSRWLVCRCSVHTLRCALAHAHGPPPKLAAASTAAVSSVSLARIRLMSAF